MQLPRGTFCGIRKGGTVEGLIAELERSRFSGICSLSSRAGTGTFVFEGGMCILAKFLGKTGDAGCTELRKIRTEKADAALSTLDNMQIQLSLEFNKSCRLVKMTSPLVDSTTITQPTPDQVQTTAPPFPAESFFESPAQPPPAAGRKPQPAIPATRGPLEHPTPQAEAPAGEEADTRIPDRSFENDIDTLENMDIDTVSDKIRNDCKTIIKELNLEHLMER